MHCPSCGVKLPPNADFCMYCGSQIGGPDPDAHAPPPDPEHTEQEPPETEAPPHQPEQSRTGPWGADATSQDSEQRGPWGEDYEFPETEEPRPTTVPNYPSGAPKTPAPERKTKSGPPPVPPPPDTMNRWQKLLLGLSIAVVVGIVGTYWVGTQKPSAPLPDTKVVAQKKQPGATQKQTVPASERSALERSIRTHLAALKQGDISGAYRQMSSVYREETSVREFAVFVQTNSDLWTYARYRIGEPTRRNDIIRVDVTLFKRNGAGRRARFELTPDAGQWRILNVVI